MAHFRGWFDSHPGRSLEQKLLMPAAENLRRCCGEHPEARQVPLGQKTTAGKRLTRRSSFQHGELLPKQFMCPRTNVTQPKKMRLDRSLREFGTKGKKKEEAASHGSQLGPEGFHHTMAATGELIGQAIHQVRNNKPGHTRLIKNHLRLKKSAKRFLKMRTPNLFNHTANV
jgi:hypothetical protein